MFLVDVKANLKKKKTEKSMKKLIFLFFSAVVTTNIFASILGDNEYICPLCGTKFNSLTSYSGYIQGQNLDLRPYGPIMITSPICPAHVELALLEQS